MKNRSEENKNKVKKLKEIIEKSLVIGVANMEGLPASALANMRKKLRGSAEIIMDRKTILQLAIDASKEKKQGIENGKKK